MPLTSVRPFVPAVALAALLLLAPAAADAQSVVEQQANRITQTMNSNGLSKRLDRDGGLHQSEAMELVVNVSPSSDVVIVGVCDQDCSDLDLRISKDGTTLGEDVLVDDNPIVRLQGFGGGELRVRVEMASCSIAPCAFRVMVYSR